MHSIHAGCSKGACAVYNLGKHYVMPSLWKHTLASSTHNCGIRKRELGAGSSTKGIWTLCGCLGKRRLESWSRKRQTATAPKGCCPGPYVTVAPASSKRVQLWLCAAHLMHQADTAATCHMGRTTLCPHQLIASRWWSPLERASEEERHKCLAQLLDWCAERDREGQAAPASRVARGAPAPPTHTLPEASASSGSIAAGHTDNHPPAGPQADSSEARLDTPPRPTGARTNRARTPSPPKRRSRVRCYLRQAESTNNTKGMETDAQASRLNVKE